MATFEERVLARLEGTQAEAPVASPAPSVTPEAPTGGSFEQRVLSRLEGMDTTPVAQTTQDVAQSLTKFDVNTPKGAFDAAIVQPAIEDFNQTVLNLKEDPFGTIKEGLINTVETGEQFLDALWNSKIQTAMGLGGELAGRASRVPALGSVGELAGTTVGKMIEEDKAVGEATADTLQEMLAGRVLAKVGGSMLKVGSNDPKQIIKDNTISREVAANVRRNWNEAQEQLGLEGLPKFLGVDSAYTGKLAEDLSQKVQEATQRGGSAGSTAFYKEVLDKPQKAYEQAFSKGVKTPDISKLDTELKTLTSRAMDEQLKGVGDIVEANNILASKSKAKLNSEGLAPMVDELRVKAEKRALAEGVDIKGAEDVAKAFDIVDSVLRKPTTVKSTILDSAGKPISRPAGEISLADWAGIEKQLDDLSTKFSENKARQNQIDGVIGSIKKELLSPYENGVMALAKTNPTAVHPDLVDYIANKRVVKEQYQGLDDVLGTRLAQVGGKTQVAQAKKAMNETKLFKDAVSSREAYDQTVRMMNKVSPQAISALNDRVIVDSLATLKGKGNVITADSVSKLIGTAGQPTARREVLERINPELVQTLENVRLIQEGIEGVTVKGAQEFKTGEKSTAELFTNLVTGTIADQQLIAGTARKGLIGKTLDRIKGARTDADRPFLDKLIGEQGVKGLEDLIPVRALDDKAYNNFRRLMTAGIVRPLSQEEYEASVEDYVEQTAPVTGNSDPSLLEILMLEVE